MVRETNLLCVLVLCLVVANVFACSLPRNMLAPTPTKAPTLTVTPTATLVPTVTLTPSPTLTPTPDIWELHSLPEYGQVMDLLGELYGDVIVLDLAMRPEAALFIVFGTPEGELLVAEIGVVDHRWKVLRVYPTEEKPPSDPGKKSERGYN